MRSHADGAEGEQGATKRAAAQGVTRSPHAFTPRAHTPRSHATAAEDEQGVNRVARSHTRSHPDVTPRLRARVHTPRSHTRSHADAAEDEEGASEGAAPQGVTRSPLAFTPRVHKRVHTQPQPKTLLLL